MLIMVMREIRGIRHLRRDSAGVIVAVLILSLCGCSAALNCTDIGAVSQVAFEFRTAPSYRGAVLTARACVGDVCTTSTVAVKHPRHLVRVVSKQITAGTTLVKLTVLDEGHHQVFAGATTVMPVKFQPNGAECGPTVWQASVVAHGTSRLVQVR